MMYSEEEIKLILKESNEDIKLKKYLDKIKKIFGDDYAVLILSCDYDIVKSINKFTSKISNINSTHIQFLLLQAALLSNNNYYKRLIEEKIEESDYEGLFPFISSNILFRKELVRLFIEQSDKNNYDIFNKKEFEEKDKIINNIKELKTYERFLRVQKEMDDNFYIKRKRRR